MQYQNLQYEEDYHQFLFRDYYNRINKRPAKKLKLYPKCRVHGAGTLFISQAGGETFILLGKRQSGKWSIAGGGAERTDKSNWKTACRETREEFGKLPKSYKGKLFSSIKFKFLHWYEWETFVIKLPKIPDINRFPDRRSIDFNEFSTAKWFPISYLPNNMHYLMYPVIWNLKKQLATMGLSRNVHPLAYNKFAAA